VQTDDINPEIPGWLYAAVLGLGIGAAPAMGLRLFLRVLADGMVGGFGGHWLGGHFFGEDSDGQKLTTFAGGVLVGAAVANKGWPPFNVPDKTPVPSEPRAISSMDDVRKIVAEEQAALARIAKNAKSPDLAIEISARLSNAKAVKELNAGRLPGIPNRGQESPRNMPASSNPNKTAEDFAVRLFNGEAINKEPLPECIECWKAQKEDGTWVTYIPTGRTGQLQNTARYGLSRCKQSIYKIYKFRQKRCG